jgi:outer membrane protein TolC
VKFNFIIEGYTLIANFYKPLLNTEPSYCAGKLRYCIVYLASISLLAGCGSVPTDSSIAQSTVKPEIATAYASKQSLKKIDFARKQAHPDLWATDGLGLTSNIPLSHAIAQALLDNHTIKEYQALVAQAHSQVIVSKANQGFNLDLSNTSNLQSSGLSSSLSSNTDQKYDLSLQGSWNPDIWGDLSAQSKASQLQLARAQANLKRAKQQLVADITDAWYQLIYQQKQFDLSTSEQSNTQDQLAAIEFAYNQGLNNSLDVYLARTNLENARSNTVANQQALSEASRSLELLFAVYPSGKLSLQGELAKTDSDVALGVPSNLLRNRSDLNSRWLNVLIEDANVASRYAQQFPQLNLTGNLSLTASRLSDLFKQNLAWSLLASVNQALIDNGKKEALYDSAKAALIISEQQYLQALKSAFNEVENLLDNRNTITEQWRLNKLALINTELSLEQVNFQYQNGIANYQQVLDIQQQLFERQKSHLDFNMQLITNRIALLLALGSADSNTKQIVTATNNPPVITPLTKEPN